MELYMIILGLSCFIVFLWSAISSFFDMLEVWKIFGEIYSDFVVDVIMPLLGASVIAIVLIRFICATFF